MTITTSSGVAAPAAARRWLLRLPFLALLLAVAAVVLLGLAPLGWRAGWWHYRVGLLTLLPWAGYCGIAAAVVSVLSMMIARQGGRARHLTVGFLAFAIGLAIAYVPWHYDRMRDIFPRINDITTDWQNPPQFRAVVPLREKDHANPTAYGGDKTSAQQRRAYPDIAPLPLPLDPGKAFAGALDAAQRMGWTIVAEDPAEGRIEASQRSRWFGFTDDIVIRVTSDNQGSRIDVRSLARFGRSDFGVNAARVRAYLAMLREVTQTR